MVSTIGGPGPKLSPCPWSQDHSNGASLRASPCLLRDRGGVHPEESWGVFRGDPVLHCVGVLVKEAGAWGQSWGTRGRSPRAALGWG